MFSRITDLQDAATQNFRKQKSYFRNSIANLSRSYLNQHRWSPNTKLLTRTFRTTPKSASPRPKGEVKRPHKGKPKGTPLFWRGWWARQKTWIWGGGGLKQDPFLGRSHFLRGLAKYSPNYTVACLSAIHLSVHACLSICLSRSLKRLPDCGAGKLAIWLVAPVIVEHRPFRDAELAMLSTSLSGFPLPVGYERYESASKTLRTSFRGQSPKTPSAS